MRYLIGILAAMLLTVACSKEKEAEKATEKSYETEAEIEAAMMQGREAGRAIVNRPWKDTLQLQNYVLEARAQRSKYEMQHKPRCAKAFDKGLVRLVYSTRPELGKQLFPDTLLMVKE